MISLTLTTSCVWRRPSADRANVLRLVADVPIVMKLASGNAPPTPELNSVLRARLGNSFSWLACLPLLSGARARDTFARRQAFFATSSILCS